MTHGNRRPPAGSASRLTIYVGARDHVGRHGLVSELVERAKHAGLAGVTVFGASEGYGESRHVHRTHLLAEDAPRSVVLIDEPARIASFLADIHDLVSEALVTVEDVEIVEP